MKIGINGRFLTKPFTGIGQYTRYLFEALAKQDESIELLIVVPEEVDFSFPENVEIKVLKENFPGTAGMKKTFWEQVQVPKFFIKQNVDLVHFPYPCNPWRKFNKPVIVTVHDTIPWTVKSYRKSLLTRLYQDRCRNAVKKANHVLTVSRVSKEDIHQACKVPAESISVIHNAISPVFSKSDTKNQDSVLEKYGIDPKIPYFLYFGGYDERKNVGLILDVFMNQIAPDFDVNLVLAGGKLFNDSLYSSYDHLTNQENQASLEAKNRKVIRTGFVEEADLPVLYRSSFAFLNLSKKEGFNLPIIEAAASNTPIIISDIPVHHEVIGDKAIYCPLNDSEKLANAMKKLLTDTNFYQKQKKLVEEYVCPYSWESSAKKLINIYNKFA